MRKILLISAFLTAQLVHAQYRGQVYIDLNENNKPDLNEKGMGNIVVSDGYEIVKTDASGKFDIKPHEKARFLFITVPSGYKAGKSHYIKLSKAEETYDFGIVKDEVQSADKLRFIQITDTETPLYGQWIDNVRNYAREQGASLIMHTGDICYEPGMQFHARQVNSELMRRPTYYAVGNHDLVKGEYGEKLFEDLFGPTYYSFDAGPAHFVVTPMAGGDYAPSYTQDQVIAWLKKDLAAKDKNKPLIFINHDFAVGKDFVMKGKTEEIDLKQYNLKAWLFGHWHNNFVQRVGEGNVYVISTGAPNKGGIDNSAGQFMAIDIDKDGVTHVQPVYANLRGHVAVVSPAAAGMNTLNGNKLDINVNIYDSERAVTGVHTYIYHQSGKQIAKETLQQQSDWNWRGQSILGKVAYGVNYEILTEVVYANGERELKKQPFTLTKTVADQALQLIWSANIGASVWKASPLVVDDMVLAATIDDGTTDKSKIVALDKKTGKEIWSYRTNSSVKNKLNVAEGLVLATDGAGNVYALDVKTGKLKWTKSLSGGTLPVYVTGGVVDKGIYYTGYGKYLSALNVKTGDVIWQNKDWNSGEGMPGSMLVAKDVLITGSNWNSLFAHELASGKLLWKRNDDGLRFRSGGLSFDGEYVYTTGLNGLFVLDLKTGETVRKKIFEDEFKVMASPLLLNGELIMPTSVSGVKSYDMKTLEEKWQFNTGEALVYTSAYTSPDQHKPVRTVESSVLAVGNNLYFGASDGKFYVLDQRGKLVQAITLGAPVLAEATVADHYMHVADFSGNVHCFKMK
ncbi:outer membrane protein assembly factor BamB family protein [Sphingobacterium spiritivorum]